MRALPTWVDKVHDKDRVEQWWDLWYIQTFFFRTIQFWYEIFSRCSIYDLAFKPDGSQLIVAAGNRVLVTTDLTENFPYKLWNFGDRLPNIFLGLRHKRWNTHSAT